MPNPIEDLKSLSPEALALALDNLVAESHHEIAETDAFSSEAAMTNAEPFTVDDYTIDLTQVNFAADQVTFPVTYSASGEQDPESTWNGSVIAGAATAVIDAEGKISYEDVTAERDLDEPEDVEE